MASPAVRFDPLRLRSDASLNRTLIAPMPGADPALVGRPAFELLSMAALRQIEASPGDSVTGYGIRLAHLIATLVAARSVDGISVSGPWRSAYLRYWRTIEQVWLGGGIAGRLGPALARAVRAELARLDVRHVSVEVAPHPEVLPLIGLARTPPGPDGQRIVLDFGHTAVKRGIASIDGGRLVRLAVLANLPAPPADNVVEGLLQIVADTFRSARSHGATLQPSVRLSLATYMGHGRPVDSHSLYAVLGSLPRATVQRELQQRTDAPLRLSYVHDGTAGARAVSGPRRSALIMLGTALGIGFAPPPAALLPLAARFSLGPGTARAAAP